MKNTGKDVIVCEGPAGKLPIQADDKLSRQLAMLFEGKCLGLGPTKSAQKYGYTRQRYFQLLKAFEEGGAPALLPKKTGPKSNYKRTENVVTQVIRHRFLDPDAKSEVVAQKLRQTGMEISTRSVERIITEYGLQKKTLQVSPKRQNAKD